MAAAASRSIWQAPALRRRQRLRSLRQARATLPRSAPCCRTRPPEGNWNSLEQQILRYYESGQEADRLESPFFRWEKVRTMDLLDRFLPCAPALILDVGGGAGAYAFPLAERGYVVDLVDPVPLHVEQAKQRAAIDQRMPRSIQV